MDSRNVRNFLKTIQQKSGLRLSKARPGVSIPQRTFLKVGKRTVGRSKHYDEFSDRDSQLEPSFYEEAEAVTVADTPFSHLALSDEEISEPTVPVRFTSDGFAEEVDDEAESAEKEPLEAMPLPYKMGATEAGSAFAEIIARVEEFSCVSRPSAIRYVTRGTVLKVSSLPSIVDFAADVCIVARKCLSPAMYRAFIEIYFEGLGAEAHRIPEAAQMAIQTRCGLAWKKAGLLPFGKYWSTRVKTENIRAVSFEIVPDARETRNKRRRDRHAYNKKRNAGNQRDDRITTYMAAA